MDSSMFIEEEGGEPLNVKAFPSDDEINSILESLWSLDNEEDLVALPMMIQFYSKESIMKVGG